MAAMASWYDSLWSKRDCSIEEYSRKRLSSIRSYFQETSHNLLLPEETDVGRKRTRGGELHWSYVAKEYEDYQSLLKKSIETGKSLVQLKEEARIKTAERKRRERETRKRKRSSTAAINVVTNGQPRRAQPVPVPLHGLFGDSHTTAAATRLLT
mmetsp:Transcript_18298/g.20849  ORF Transcript_18298/g.20849 Transcript_18298/m.20849 type:complete len:154 (+) Transcript_18298:553-1014(+)